MDITLFDTLKTLHVVAATLWIGGGFALNICVTVAIGSRDPNFQTHMLKTTEFVGQRIFLPLSLIVLAMGLWLTIKFDLLFSFEDFWIQYGLGAIVLTVVLGAGFLGPRSGKLAGIVESGASQDEVQRVARPLLTVARIDLLVLISVICIMVIKP